jgi:hypothetical protein
LEAIQIVVEIKGQSLRIRVKNPKLFAAGSYGTQDVGETGKLQRVAARRKTTGKYETQAWRVNLADYPNKASAIQEVNNLYDGGDITASEKSKALRLVHRWFKKEG